MWIQLASTILAVSGAATASELCQVDLPLSNEATPEAMIGTSVAMDGAWLAVGAPLDTGLAWASGTVYVYQWTDGEWVLESRLMAEDGDIGDMLGVSVDLLGDTIIAGAWFDNDDGSNSGAAYVFQRDGAEGWSQIQKLVMPDAAPEDAFGRTVALGEDFCAVGAPLDDDQGSSSGSVVVFDRQGLNPWTYATKLLHPGGASGDELGLSLAVDGNRVLAGAPWSNLGRGEIHLWQRLGSNWTHDLHMTNGSIGSPDDYFGFSVALEGNRMAAGCYRDDTYGEDAGSIWIMEKVFDGWAFANYPPPEPQAGAQYGVSLALSGERLLVGARFGMVDSVMTGRAYLLGLEDFQWPLLETLDGEGLVAEAEFGWAVAMQSERAVVGSPYQPTIGDLDGWNGLINGCDCPGDVDGDGQVGVNDMLAVLDAWGDCPEPCDADVDDNGTVDVNDVLFIISMWALC